MGDGIRCVIFKNAADHGEGRLIAVPPTINELLKTAGEKLKCKAERAYSENGAYIEDTSLIRENEKIFISEGEPFFKSDSSRVRLYKIAVLGPGGVGKSSLTVRYVRSTFIDIYDPTIEDAFRHQTVVDGSTCMLDILDTAGQEDLKMLRTQWVEDRDGFLLVFSLADKSTFIDIDQFYNLIAEVKEGNLAKVPLVLVGNKADMVDQRQVDTKDGVNDALRRNATYQETSAKTGDGVNNAFESLVRNFIKLDPPKVQEKTKKKKSPCTLL